MHTVEDLNNSPHYPLQQASLRQGQELTSMKQANGASNSSVQASNQAVSFEVGGDVSLPPTLPHDCDSQFPRTITLRHIAIPPQR